MRAKFLFIFLIATFFVPKIAAQPRGLALSSKLETLMTKQGYDTVKETLSATAQDEYPYNILVYFSTRHNTSPADNLRDMLIIALTQEDAYDHIDAVLAFLAELKKTPPSCSTIILFSAQERSPVQMPLSITGTETFARNFEDSERSAAITVRFDSASVTELHIGNRWRTTPLWLARQVTAAYAETNSDYSYADKFASLYRLGLLNSNRRLNAFISNNIPALDINLTSEPDFSALQHFVTHYSMGGSDLWDNHYLFLQIFGRDFWFGESFFFIATLILGMTLLLLLCTSTFKGKNGEDYRKDFARSWFFIPLTIAVTFFSLWLGQTVCAHIPLLAKASPIVQIGIKLIFALFFNAVLFGVQEYLRVYSVQFTHGYFIYLIGISNVFIFSTVDLIFSLTFLIEYLCIYVARKSVRIVPLMLSVLLMLFPAVPYVYQMIRYGHYYNLQQLASCTPLVNLLFALLMFPFLIMWLRMIVRLQLTIVENSFSLKRTLINESISMGVVVAILLISVATLATISNHILSTRMFQKQGIINENNNSFTLSASKTKFLDMTTRHITIKSKIDVLKYEAVISSEGSLPLYDSTYDYTVNEEIKTAFFTIPDYPPRTITIDYATDAKEAARLFVTAWYATEDENIFRKETHALMIVGGE